MSEMPPANSIPPGALALYEKLVATIPGLERKGATMPYTSLNGHMFSYLTPEGTLALRLPQQARDDFLRKYNTTLVMSHGASMKEYVAVPASLLKKTKQLQKYFAHGYDYVKSLKPKPTRKAKPATR